MSRPNSLLRQAACMLLVAAALLLQAVVPQGYMVGEDASGSLAIEICHSDQVIVIPMKDTAPSHDSEEAAAKACAFAAGHDSTAPADPNTRLRLPQLAQAAYDALREKALSPDTPADIPPATGPPTLV